MSTFIVVPSELTSVLSAVNLLIGSLGETAVSTIDPPPTSDVDDALLALNRADFQVQLKGWSWNKEKDLQTTLDASGRVVLPDQTLRVAAAYYTSRAVLDVVQRGAYLYDRDEHTYDFTAKGAPKIDYITRLDWEYLPEAARQYIMYKACMEFHAQKQERSILLRVTDARVADALLTLEQYEDEVAQHSTLTNNAGVETQMGGARRNRQGLS